MIDWVWGSAMLSRYSFAALALVVSFMGCAGEQEVSTAPIKPKLKLSGDCLASFGSRVNQFFKGELDDQKVVAFWDCTADAIRQYRRMTSGERRPDAYSPEAMARFFREYLSVTLDNGLVASMMELKRVILSGESGQLTWGELDLLQEFIGELKVFSLHIRPHVQVMFGSHQGYSPQRVEQATQAFALAMGRIGDWLQNQNQEYSFEHLQQLLRQIREQMQENSAEQSWLESLDKGIAVLRSGKRLLLSGSDSAIAGNEWQFLSRLLARGFSVYLNLAYALEADLHSALSGEFLPQALKESSEFLQLAVSRRLDARIPLAEFKEVINQAQGSGWLPEGFTADAVYDFFVWFVHRPLGFGDADIALNLSHLEVLKTQVQLWREIYAQPTVLEDFNAVIETSVPMQWDELGRMLFAADSPRSWSVDNRRRLVWAYVLLNWIRKSYVGEKTSLSEQDVSLVAAEILPRLQAFGWLQSTQVTIGKRLLREADVFTLASDGNLELGLHEAVRYLSFVASAHRAAQIWLSAAQANCPQLEVECVRAVALMPGAGVLDSMPILQQRMRSAAAPVFIEYMQRAEETILKKVQTGSFTTSDLMQVWMIFQYVETFLARFDVQKDQVIVLAEGLRAFEVYGPTLGKMLSSTGLPEQEIMAFFTFMLKYGDIPFSMLGGQVLFNHWKWHRNDWDFSADRGVLLSILYQLSKF